MGLGCLSNYRFKGSEMVFQLFYHVGNYDFSLLGVEKSYNSNTVIDNPILSVYRYRFLDDLGAGDELVLNFPRRRFRVKYEGVREIKIKNMQEKARVFRGYPVGFQVWLKEGKQKLPLKIENPRLFGYALVFTKVDYFDR